MFKKKVTTWIVVLVLFSLLEFLMLSYLKGYFGIYFSPVIFFISSAGVSISALYAAFFFKETPVINQKYIRSILLMLPLLIGLLYYGYSVFSQFPVDSNQSDVFAQVLSPSTWLLTGEYPYQDVVLPTYTMHNTYLPMQWLPFILAVIFSIDPRWIPLTAWVIMMIFFLYFLPVSQRKWDFKFTAGYFLTGVLAIFSMYGFISENSFDYAVTLEMLPVAYYIGLTLSLLRGNWFFMGLSMGCCLMSRFSILLFVPFLMWYVWKRFGSAVFLKSCVTTVVFIILIFILPFMLKDPQLVSKIAGNYENGAFGEWQVHGWQQDGEEPYQLARGLGAAIFFKRLYEYDIESGIQHIKEVGTLLSGIIAIFMIYLYQRNRKFLNHDWVLLGGVKLYLTIFYTFVLIPYPYLYVLPVTMTSLMILKAYSDYSRFEIRDPNVPLCIEAS
ncbi:MAG: hypothetical protein WBP08_17485 [Saprospiraceae bacterium]|nr:hypothetical protein [Saprospiraceae bacterium]